MDVREPKPLDSHGSQPVISYAWHRLLIVGLGIVVFGVNLGATRLWDVDEAIFSQAAAEMMHRGDLVTPYYNGRLFSHKPPLMYWCQIAAYQVFGPTELAARLFSALFCLGTLLVTYELGCMLFNARTGLWAGVALTGCINFVVIARAATPDAHLTFFCTLALWLLVRGTRNRSVTPWQPILPGGVLTYVLAYLCMALATLVKGPVGLVIPMAVWGMFLLIEQFVVSHRKSPMSSGVLLAGEASSPRSERLNDEAAAESLRSEVRESPATLSLDNSACQRTSQTWVGASFRWIAWFVSLFWPRNFLMTVWRMRPLTAILVVTLVAGPWYCLVGLRTDGEFLREFFLVQNLGRASHVMESHQGPFFYYLIAVCIGTFPWCTLLWPALIHVTRAIRCNDPARAGYVLISCWIWVWIGCFSLVATKLSSYIIPAYPAIALGFAALVDSVLRKEPGLLCRGWLRRAWITIGLVGIAGLIAIPIVTRVLFDGESTSPLLLLVGLIPSIAAVIGWRFTSGGQVERAVTTLAVSGSLFGITTLGFAVLPIDAHKNTHLIGASIREHSAGVPHLATYKYSPPSLVFYSQITFDRLRSRADVAEHFQKYSQDAFLLTTEKQILQLGEYLPSDVVVLRTERMFLKQENIVLLRRRPTSDVGLPIVARHSQELPLQ